MSALVVDASVALALLLNQELNPELIKIGESIFAGEVLVPPIFLYEVANVVTQQGKKWRRDQLSEVIDFLESWPITVDIGMPNYDELVGTALNTQLTAYDAAYIALAKRVSCPLATQDKQLAAGATAFGVKTLI